MKERENRKNLLPGSAGPDGDNRWNQGVPRDPGPQALLLPEACLRPCLRPLQTQAQPHSYPIFLLGPQGLR